MCLMNFVCCVLSLVMIIGVFVFLNVCVNVLSESLLIDVCGMVYGCLLNGGE